MSVCPQETQIGGFASEIYKNLANERYDARKMRGRQRLVVHFCVELLHDGHQKGTGIHVQPVLIRARNVWITVQGFDVPVRRFQASLNTVVKERD